MRLVFVSRSLFPTGTAYSTRVMRMSQIFAELGWSVHVISDGSLESEPGRVHDFDYGTYEAVGRIGRTTDQLRNSVAGTRALRRYVSQNKVDLVVIGNVYDRFEPIMTTCRRNGIPVLLEICEWYDTSTWRLGALNPYAKAFQTCMRSSYRRVQGVIAISRLLEGHFRGFDIPTIRLPGLLDTVASESEFDPGKNDRISLVHLGFSGINKEKYGEVMAALRSLSASERRRFQYRIYGADEGLVARNLGTKAAWLSEMSDVVEVCGRIPQHSVHAAYRNADYSTFFRPPKLSNDAGFPTKLAESFLAGTPTITNATGDIPLYLKDGSNGYLLEDFDLDSTVSTLRNILTLDDPTRRSQRVAARATAEDFFDYRRYLEPVRQLVAAVRR